MAKKRANQTRPPDRGDSPITVGGGGGRRGLKLYLRFIPADWDLTKINDGFIELKDSAKGAKKLTLTSDDVSLTAPLKGSIYLEVTAR